MMLKSRLVTSTTLSMKEVSYRISRCDDLRLVSLPIGDVPHLVAIEGISGLEAYLNQSRTWIYMFNILGVP